MVVQERDVDAAFLLDADIKKKQDELKAIKSRLWGRWLKLVRKDDAEKLTLAGDTHKAHMFIHHSISVEDSPEMVALAEDKSCPIKTKGATVKVPDMILPVFLRCMEKEGILPSLDITTDYEIPAYRELKDFLAGLTRDEKKLIQDKEIQKISFVQ
jgi:hypothetical protein